MDIRPFHALRARADLADRVSAVPYDTVDTTEARVRVADNPWSFLRVTRADLDFPDDTDPHSDEVYDRAARHFADLQARGAFVRDPEPSLYLYRQAADGHAQDGVLACCSVRDYESGVIRRHEKVRPQKVRDRARLQVALTAQTGPVFLIHRPSPDVARIANQTRASEPLCRFHDPEGVEHTLWRIPDTRAAAAAFAGIPAAYIADGHHRAAAAAAVARDNPAAPAGSDRFLALLYPADQVRILPYHRCVLDLNGRTPDAFRAEVRRLFPTREDAPPAPNQPGRVVVYTPGRHIEANLRADAAPPGTDALDVQVLQDRLLAPVLGIDDPTASARIEFIGGVGADAIRDRVESGRAAAGFVLHPVRTDQIMAVADAGGILPPKSTWFAPKPRSGLVVRLL